MILLRFFTVMVAVYALWMAAEFLSSPDVDDPPGLDQVDHGSDSVDGLYRDTAQRICNQDANQPGC